MNDLVERQAAIDALCSKCSIDKPETCSTIQKGDKWCDEVYILLNLPSVQPEIIYCGECVHLHDNDCPMLCGRQLYDFCSWAEREGEDETD